MTGRRHLQTDSRNKYFALKTFSTTITSGLDLERLQKEIKGNKFAPQHDRIVPLLAAFEHQGIYNLVFPWASGQSLHDLCKKFDPVYFQGKRETATWFSPQWVLGECFGLADALAHVHGLVNTGSSREAPQAQIHADLKLENVLCFALAPDDPTAGLVLKLADFGEAELVGQDGIVMQVAGRVAHIKTYRPPEYSHDGLLTLTYDIWCLGCLFLDFITWALLGYDGVEEFQRARREEQEDPDITGDLGQVFEDTFFKRVRATRSGLPFSGITWAGPDLEYVAKPGRFSKRRFLPRATPVHIRPKVKESVQKVSQRFYSSSSQFQIPNDVSSYINSSSRSFESEKAVLRCASSCHLSRKEC